MGGSKGSQTVQNQAQTQSYSANPTIAAGANQAEAAAQQAAATPFSMPVAPVAGFSPLQQQVFQQYGSLVNQPYYQQAGQLYGQSAAPISASDVANYYNPMAANVTANLQDIFGAQNAQNTANLVQSAGGIGADRIAVGQADMAKQQGLAAGQTYANLYQSALSAAQQQKALESGAASGLAGLGGQTLGGANAAGLQQQQQQQAQLNAPYQNILAQLAYPFQTAQYLAGVTGGLAPALGGTTNGFSQTISQPPTPSLLNQIVGLGTAGAGLYGTLGGSGGSPVYGGGNAFTDAYGGSSANPLPGLTAADYGIGYADGGEVEGEGSNQPSWPGVEGGGNSIVPYIPLHEGAGHSGPLTGGMQFSNPNSGQQQQQQQSSGINFGDIAKLATSVAPLLLKQGGSAYPKFADGEDVPYGPDESGSGPVASFLQGPIDAIRGGWNRFNSYAPPAPGAKPDPGASIPFIGPANAAGAAGAEGHVPGTGYGPMETGESGAAFPVPLPRPRPTPPHRRSSAGVGPGGASDISTDGSDQMPYPNATGNQGFGGKDWGLALMNIGATIASTPGPLGSAIGKGLLTGTKTLQEQRKEGRSDEELNQKAKALQQKAKEHLDELNKMTPYQRASLALKNKELDQEGASDATMDLKTRRALAVQTRNYFNQLARQEAARVSADITGKTQPRSNDEIWAEAHRRARQDYGLTGGVPAAPTEAPAKTVVRTGVDKSTGKNVVQYSDGSIEYQ